jgi:uncharacterized protein involved in exopolysaccharide biosynthesis
MTNPLRSLAIGFVIAIGCCAQTPTLTQYLDKQIADTTVQLAVAHEKYANTHPEVLTLESRLDSLRRRRAALEGQPDDAQVLARELDVEIAAAQTRVDELKQRYSPTHPNIRKAQVELQTLTTLRTQLKP